MTEKKDEKRQRERSQLSEMQRYAYIGRKREKEGRELEREREEKGIEKRDRK